MACSVRRSRLAKVAGVSPVLLLTVCSSDSHYKHQVSGDETYLETALLAELHAPAGMTLPVTFGDYAISVTNGSGVIGKALGTRPSAQPLTLVSGTRTQFMGDTVSLLVENGCGNIPWPQVISVLQVRSCAVIQRDDTDQTLTTDWVQWSRLGEDEQYRSRYQISVKPQGYQQAVTTKLLNLGRTGKPVADAASMQRYNTGMVNVILAGLNKSAIDAANAAQNRASTIMDIQSAAGDTGLLILVARRSPNVVWQRLPAALEKMGMRVTDSTRPQDNMVITYEPLSNSKWHEPGASDLGLASGDYKPQVGGLDNRSSLQFIDPKGHTLTQSQNDALVAVLQVAFSK